MLAEDFSSEVEAVEVTSVKLEVASVEPAVEDELLVVVTAWLVDVTALLLEDSEAAAALWAPLRNTLTTSSRCNSGPNFFKNIFESGRSVESRFNCSKSNENRLERIYIVLVKIQLHKRIA